MMNNQSNHWVCGALLTAAAFGSACIGSDAMGDRDPKREVNALSEAVVGGTEATAAWPGIGVLETKLGQCTASLIAPHVILTAAHCFGFENNSDSSRMSGTFAYGDQAAPFVSHILRFSSFGNDYGKTDIAVAELDKDAIATDPEWTPPLAVVDDDWLPTTGASAIAKFGSHPWTMVYGFGCDNPFLVADADDPHWACPPNTFGTKRRLDIDWEDVMDLTVESQGQMAPMLAHGDSGGPMLVADTRNIISIVSTGYVYTDRNTGALVSTEVTFGDVYGNRAWILNTAASF